MCKGILFMNANLVFKMVFSLLFFNIKITNEVPLSKELQCVY